MARIRSEGQMDEWVYRALKRWPNVPALYGWLKLNRRGRWLIKGETIGRTQIVDVINRNYASDERGCWYFQNGPQRGYMQLERAPFIVLVENFGSCLRTHNQLMVERIDAAFMDEQGGFFFQTEHGPAALLDSDLDWALTRLFVRDQSIGEQEIATAFNLPSGETTAIAFRWNDQSIPVERLDDALAPERLKFVREPKPPCGG